jgi:hypothetical protein
LLKLLKLFGFDPDAAMNSVKQRLDVRLEEASESAGRVARDAAVVSALLAAAAVTTLMAAVVGLIALYRWSADAIGPYGGLAVVGGVLLLAAIAFFVGAGLKFQSLQSKSASHLGAAGRAGDNAAASDDSRYTSAAASIADASAIAYRGETDNKLRADNSLRKPFAFLLSEVIGEEKGGPLTALLGKESQGADEAFARAADIVEHGGRGQAIVVLIGGALLGWLLTRYPGRTHC